MLNSITAVPNFNTKCDHVVQKRKRRVYFFFGGFVQPTELNAFYIKARGNPVQVNVID